MGYSSTQKGYKCYHPPTKRFFDSIDVIFIFFLSETKRNILIEGKIQEKEKKKETKETTRRMRGPSYTN